MTKKIITLFSLILIYVQFSGTKAFSQKTERICVYIDEGVPNLYALTAYKNFPSKEAQGKFNDMCKVASVSSNDYKLYSVPDFSGGAYARQYNGIKEIGYDPQFMNSIDTRGDGWCGYSIIAHELGHHVRGMAGMNLHYIELIADEYSGYLLALKGATLEEALRAMKLLGSNHDTATHPNKTSRMQWIKQGWEKAKAGQEL